MINFNTLTKVDLVKYTTARCRHRHKYTAHENCFIEEQIKKERIGFLDIEAEDLNADYGIMFSWAIKDNDSDAVYKDVLNEKDIKQGKSQKRDIEPKEDKRIVESLVQAMQNFDRFVLHFGCVMPGHKVLKSNLDWVNVEDLKVGDGIIGCDEEPIDVGEIPRRFFRVGKVVNNIPIKKEVFEIKFKDGSIINASGDHPWLVKRSNHWVWKKTSELIHFNNRINCLNRVLNVWKNSHSEEEKYMLGYLAGFFDGEGHIDQSERKFERRGNMLSIVASQHSVKNEQIYNRVLNYLKKLGFNYGICSYDKRSVEQKSITIRGGLDEKLRFISQTKLARGSYQFRADRLSAVSNIGDVEIESIKSIGTKTVCGLQTDISTYIVEGFLSHNTYFDLPFIRTRAIICDVEYPSYGTYNQTDTWKILKGKTKLSRNSLENACQKLVGVSRKDRLSLAIKHGCLRGEAWALKDCLEHNVKDVLDTQDLFRKLEKHTKLTKTSF